MNSSRPGDSTPDGEEDELFAAVSAAISRPPRRDSESFETDPEPDLETGTSPEPVTEQQDEIDLEPDSEPQPQPEDPATSEHSAWDDLFAPAPVGRDGDGGDGGDGDDLTPADEEPRRRRRWPAYTLLGAAAVLGAAYVGGYFLTGIRMPDETTISGVDVSGQSPEEARATLVSELTPRTEQPIMLTFEDTDFEIKPADAGLSFDPDASVDEAGGARSWDPRDMVALVVGDNPHDAVVTADSSKFDSVLGTLGEAVDVEVVEAQITFPDAKPKARAPEEGRVVDRPATTEVIEAGFVADEGEGEIATTVVEPAVDQAGLDEAMDGLAATAVSGPVKLEVGDDTIDLPVTAFAPALVVRVEDGALTPFIDPEKLAEPLTDSTTGIGSKAVDATVKIENDKPVVVPGKSGVGLQPEEMSTKLLPAVQATGDDRLVSIEAKKVDPAFTTDDAKALKITEKVSEFETVFPYAEYRNVNQGRAAEILDGTIVKPGETFSFNDTVGERTEANGFTTGTVINGGVFREELGGGVSQTVTTTYNAAFFAGMDDTEHHPHAFYLDRYPTGREATVYFGSLDLRFKNPTDYGVLIRSYIVPSTPGSNGVMHVEMWSTKVWDEVRAGASERRNFRTPGIQYDDSDRCVPQAPIQGFDIDIFRTFVKDGKDVKSETDTAVYQAADRVVCGPKPSESDEDD